MITKHIPGPDTVERPCYLCAYSNRGYMLQVMNNTHHYHIPVCPSCAYIHDLGQVDDTPKVIIPDPPATPRYGGYTIDSIDWR